MASVLNRVEEACNRAGRDPISVRIVGVSKTVSAEKISEAIAAGITIIGENRVQEARDKIVKVHGNAEWHLIGHLQKNKVKYIFDLFQMMESLDSLDLAKAIDNRAEKGTVVFPVLIEVNVGEEKSKSGLLPKTVLESVKEMARLKWIRIRGLMAVPPYSENPEDSRSYFRHLGEIQREIQAEGIDGVELQELSMGMTNDFEVAVEEGATLVRIGRAIFGERQN